METSILVVEDEPAIREMLEEALTRAGFSVRGAADADAADVVVGERLPDLILLDWMLPGTSGIDYARRLKRAELTREVPLIMLTARGDESDRLAGFGVGVDDYVAKPFSMRELVARMRAVLRRVNGAAPESPLNCEGLCLDPVSHRISGDGAAIKLGPMEFRMLHFFMTNTERVFTRSQLLDRIWGSNVYIEERTVDVHVRRLRKALAPFGYDRLVQTVHGTGYRFSRHPA